MLRGDGVPTEFRGTTFPLGPATSFGPLLERRRPSLTTATLDDPRIHGYACHLCSPLSESFCRPQNMRFCCLQNKTLLSVQIPIHPLLPRHNYHKLAFQTKLRKEYGSKLSLTYLDDLGWLRLRLNMISPLSGLAFWPISSGVVPSPLSLSIHLTNSIRIYHRPNS